MILGITGEQDDCLALSRVLQEVVPGAACVSLSDPIKKFCHEVFGNEDHVESCTDWGRAFYPEVWVEHGLRRAQDLLRTTTTRYDPRDPQPATLVLLTDVRFRNEREAVRAAGGRVVRIIRPGCEPDGHPSEAQDFPADYTVDNDGTGDDLRAEAQRLVRWLEEQ